MGGLAQRGRGKMGRAWEGQGLSLAWEWWEPVECSKRGQGVWVTESQGPQRCGDKGYRWLGLALPEQKGTLCPGSLECSRLSLGVASSATQLCPQGPRLFPLLSPVSRLQVHLHTAMARARKSAVVLCASLGARKPFPRVLLARTRSHVCPQPGNVMSLENAGKSPPASPPCPHLPPVSLVGEFIPEKQFKRKQQSLQQGTYCSIISNRENLETFNIPCTGGPIE